MLHKIKKRFKWIHIFFPWNKKKSLFNTKAIFVLRMDDMSPQKPLRKEKTSLPAYQLSAAPPKKKKCDEEALLEKFLFFIFFTKQYFCTSENHISAVISRRGDAWMLTIFFYVWSLFYHVCVHLGGQCGHVSSAGFFSDAVSSFFFLQDL